MSTQQEPAKRAATKQPDQANPTVHPETQQRVKKSGVPDDESSKVPSTTEQDARGTHDRDGNAEQSRKTPGERHG